MKWFKYLGKEQHILALYDAMRARDDKASHPTQLCPETGLDMHTVQALLDATQDLFVRLPRNPEGLVRYRITSSASAMSREQVAQLVKRRARTEKLQLVAAVAIFGGLALIMLMTVIPATSMAT